jgi:putative toxin-antitoxin system antitoxin component (TIGR02293 family)
MRTAVNKPAQPRVDQVVAPVAPVAPAVLPVPISAQEPVPRWPVPAGDGAAASLGAIEFMGGRRLFKAVPQSRTEIHAALVQGLPCALLLHLVDHLSALSLDEVADALGISGRTLRRLRDQPAKPMPADLASKTWLIAETLAQASVVFGGREAAERWMTRPAMGLDGARPIDLLRTLQGAELVTEFLGRLAHGVYN